MWPPSSPRSGSTAIPRRLLVGLLLLVPSTATRGQAPESPSTTAAPPAAALPAASTPAKTAKTVDLSNRYRFIERYPREDGREGAGAVGPYRVGLFEVVKDVVDQPQGAPRRSETSRQSVFIERATEQTGLGGVIGSVRFYERFEAKPDDPARTMGANPLDGLSLASRFRSADWALVSSLTERKPTDYEFEVVTRQLVVPQVSLVLPGQPVRIGDSWRISRRAAQALLGEPGAKGDTLIGKFNELRKEVDGARLVAVLGVSGRITTPIGETAVNAEILFTFTVEAPDKASPDRPAGASKPIRTVEGLLDGRGAITEVRLARSAAGPLPGVGRLRFQTTREVTMQRQLDIGVVGDQLPKFPSAPRVEDPATWLTWVSPTNLFRFEHSQDLLPPERPALVAAEPNSTALVRTRREGTDLIQLDYATKALGPDDLKAKLAAKYGQMKLKVIEGQEGWLPEIDWPPTRKVYRVEAAVEVPAGGDQQSTRATRIHFDGYLIQTGQAASLLVIATTSREPIGPFRREVEQILKSIQVDQSAAGTTK